ncbi:unnamed protein product [Dracunculus medinensis]|uniref:Dihydroorotate dehydrogenase (quinone), mitochondrial n=1 Tax=Dracunculus medinensis TaxID=318479 RepID=A0A3P7PMM5_DRAME|nr:unnamed protein product [Dracunculus medinensis]
MKGPTDSRLIFRHIFKSTIILSSCGTAFYGITEFLIGNESFFKNQFMPLIYRFVDPETAHYYALKMFKYGIVPKFGYNYREYDELKCSLFGKNFKNPIGLAAGFDKDGEVINSLRNSGFGFIEIGTITPLPQEGNPKPRIFRLVEDGALINRYGFNNAGVGIVSSRVKKASEDENNSAVPLGVNIGKNKETEKAWVDYSIGVNYFGLHCDYLVINVSSPNTPGLRSLQNKNELQNVSNFYINHKSFCMMHSEQFSNKTLLFRCIILFIDIANVSLDRKYGIDGLIIANTTIDRPPILTSNNKTESGGLSGKPLGNVTTELIRHFYKITGGKIPIIGCGGVSSGKDAYEKIRAGASLVQLYTSIIYEGFPVIGKIKRELVDLLRQDGFKNVSEAIGADH